MSSFSLARYNGAFTDAELLQQLREDARNFCAVHGAVMVLSDAESSYAHVPCTLLPLPLPRSVFTSSTELAPLMNFLYDRVARDTAFLTEVLAPAARSDNFMAMLMRVLSLSERRGDAAGAVVGPLQPLALTIARSDYMMDVDPVTGAVKPLQVEMNMIASSFGCLSSRIAAMHRYVIAHNPKLRAQHGIESAAVPANPAREELAASMAAAIAAFAARHIGVHARSAEAAAAATAPLGASEKLHVLMVVQKGERNSADQRHLEYALWENHSVPMLRRSLDQLHKCARVDAATGALFVDGARVALVYYRAGYTPADFPGAAEEEAMLNMELSLAIKCPSVAHHLAGTKKVQQVLADPAVLRRYLSPRHADRLAQLFAGIWPLEGDDDATRAIIARAVANPDDFVLKPQREGGGNNFWGDEMVAKLQMMASEERAAFILMARIRAGTATQALMRLGDVSVGPCVSELGVYAVMLSDGGDGNGRAPAAAATIDFAPANSATAGTARASRNPDAADAEAEAQADHETPAGPVPLLNAYAGYLLRTKKEGTNEGGVAAGFSGLNSLYLHDD